jgi:hypothetical protein
VEGGDGGAVDEEPPGVAQQGGGRHRSSQVGSSSATAICAVVLWWSAGHVERSEYTDGEVPCSVYNGLSSPLKPRWAVLTINYRNAS